MALDFEERPILVFWESTRACLLACKHCRAEAIRDPLPGELGTEEGKNFISQLTGFGKPYPVLIITGGDAFMRRDLWDLVSHARSLGIPVALAPSVTPLLTTESMARLKDLGVHTVSISLDGARPETHEAIRGVPGHFERTLEALRNLVAMGFTVQVNTAVMKDNVEELAEVAALIKGIGVSIWEVFFLVHVGRATRGAEEITPEEHEDVCHFLYDASHYGFIVRTVEGPFFRRVVAWRRELPAGSDPAEVFSLGPLYRRLSKGLLELLGPPLGQSRAQTRGTRDGKGIVFVGYSGDVYPAGFLPLPLGNVKETSIVEIYRGSPILKAIRASSFAGRCGVCEFRDLCGGSRARAFAAYGDPLAEDPACIYEPRGASVPSLPGALALGAGGGWPSPPGSP